MDEETVTQNNFYDFCENMSKFFDEINRVNNFLKKQKIGNEKNSLFNRVVFLYRMLITVRVKQKTANELLEKIMNYSIHHLPDCEINIDQKHSCTCGLDDLKQIIEKINPDNMELPDA